MACLLSCWCSAKPSLREIRLFLYPQNFTQLNLHHLNISPHQISPDVIEYGTFREGIRKVLATLRPREEKILLLHFGIGDHTPRDYTVKEISEKTGLSRSAVYNSLKRGLEKLGSSPRKDYFKKYLLMKQQEEVVLRPLSNNVISVIEATKKLTPELILYLKSHNQELSNLQWDVFQHLVAEFFASMGYYDVRLVGKNSETSAEIYAATKLGSLGVEIRLFIEVKRWKNKLGIEIINEVHGAMLLERPKFGWHAAIIVSIAGFRKFHKFNQTELALRGIELKDKNDLLRWLKDYKPNKNGLWLPQPEYHNV
ncbi:MAG: restriction endonuclease [Cyanobacteriota bacterium]